MALSYVQYAGNGTETNFSVTFPYLDKSHIVVKVDGSPVAFTWINSTTVNITPAPGAGTVVDLRRDTPAITPVVDFTDGSIVTEDQLDTNARQALFVSQEAQDISAAAMVRDDTGSWNGAGSRIGNVADPVNDQDVVTKASVAALTDAAVAAAQGHATSASGSASTANAAKIESELHADNAHESALQAAASAAAAAASFDAFDDRYLGAKPSAPTVDNDGAPLLIGALYYDTNVGLMRQWDGASWLDIATGISQTSGDARYVRLVGATMTGALTLPNSSPSNDNHATRKKYVDDSIAAVNTAIAGRVLQHAYIGASAYTPLGGVIPYDDTIPQNTEGTQFLQLTFTPKKSTSVLLIEAYAWGAVDGSTYPIMSLFKDSTADAFAAAVGTGAGAPGAPSTVFLKKQITSGQTTAMTITVRGGCHTSATWFVNAKVGGPTRLFGGAGVSYLSITELDA